MKGFGCVILFALLIQVSFAEYDEICVRFAEGTEFREPGNCQSYVVCKNGIGTLKTCPKGQLYDKDNGKCVASLNDAYCKDACKSKSNVFVSDPTNCDGYYYCDSGKSVPGYCSTGYHFDQKSQMCVFPSDSTCTGVSDFCGIIPNKVPFSDPKNCNKYFECTKGSLKQVSCSSGLYFDIESGKCKSMYEVSCAAHPIPANICGKDKKPIYDSCVEDQVSCRGYYYCAYKGAKLSDKKPTWNQCPEGLFFNIKKQMCYDPTETPCKHNRCEGRGDSKVIAEDWGCRYFYTCKDGLVQDKIKCPKDMFFDEKLQACTLNETSYSVCDY